VRSGEVLEKRRTRTDLRADAIWGEAPGAQYRFGDDVLTLVDTKPTEAKLTDSP